MNTAIYLLRAVKMGLSLRELALINEGTVYDMATEMANDLQEYPVKATQADFDRF